MPVHFNPKVVVVGIYLEYEGQFLLLQRQKGKSEGGKWGVPGGKVEEGETLLEAVIRETKEETDIEISEQAIHTLSTFYIEYDGTEHFVFHTFRAKINSQSGVKIRFSEHKDFTWVSPEDALKRDLLRGEDLCIKKDYSLD